MLLLSTSVALAQPEDVVPPKLLQHVDAPYPASKLGEHIETNVVVFVTVDADGSVSDAQVVESGGPEFDEAALETARTWRFSPATRGGKPIRARIRLAFHFAPHPSAPSAPSPAPPPVSAPTPKQPPPTTPEKPPATPSPAPPVTDQHAEHTEPTVVTVIGRPVPPSRGASDFIVQVGELGRVPRKTATDLLTLAPGVLLSNEGGEGHAEQVFLRGFDAREGQDLEFSVGGVPINESGNLHGNGYADAHFILPELVETVRILEGPFDPRQGNFAVAGSAEYDLGLAQRGLTAKYTLGSFNTHRLLLLWGPRDESAHTFGGVELYASDGFGQNRDSKRATAMAQYEGKLGANSSFRILSTAYANTYHSAGVIREDDFKRGAIGFYDTYDHDTYMAGPSQGGDASRYSLSADIDARAGDTLLRQQLFVIHRGMRLRENFTGFLLDAQTNIQAPHTQRGDMIDLDMTEETIGARGSARLRGRFLDHPQELEIGYFARGDHVEGTEQRLEAANGHPYKLDTDLVSKLGDIALYADLNLRPLSWLTLRGGLRGDFFAYDVLDRCAVQGAERPSKVNPPGDASCLSQQNGDYREPTQRTSTASIALQPRASVIVGSFQGFNLNLSVGRGASSADLTLLTHDVVTPFYPVLAYEGGVSYARSFGSVAVTARSIFFHTYVEHELIFSEIAGRYIPDKPTTRTGWAVATRLTGDFFDVSANLTLVKSLFVDTGLLVPYVPDAVVRADGALFGKLPWRIRDEAIRGALGAGFTLVGHRPLPYGQRSDLLATLDASATIGISHFEVGLSATNLIGQQYRLGEYNFPSDFHDADRATTLVPTRHFTAGAPRALFATFAVNLGGE